MNWIFLAVAAQFLNALVALIDKRIVSDEKMLPRPFVYAFYTCLIAGVWILVYFIGYLPFSFEGISIPSFSNVERPTIEVVALAFLAAYTFFIGLVSMFNTLRVADAADVVPVIGATSAIASFALGHFFLGTAMTSHYWLGIIVLTLGTYLVSRYHFTYRTAFVAMHSGLFFAFHYIAIKGLFITTSFDDGFFWSRIAFVLFALSLLMIPNYFEKIKEQTKVTTRDTGYLIVANKILAGVSTILILKATDVGDVAVVQALGGLQFIFILLLGIFFSIRPAKVAVGESYESETILQKAIFVAVICIGFLLLFK